MVRGTFVFMRSFLLLSLAALGTGWAQTVTVDISNTTTTQAIIHVKAVNSDGSPFAGSCIYRISEGPAFAAVVNDVNPALFAGSNSDARPGSIVNGDHRYFIAGTRIAAKATDLKFYSRALQVDTQHWVGVTCGTAAEQSTVFRTVNLQFDAYPEAPNWDAGAVGNVGVPTIDWADKSKMYIDPLTGVLLKRITGPLDYSGGIAAGTLFDAVPAVTSTGWTSVSNANANQSTSVFASSSTQGAVLFLPWTNGAWTDAHAGLQIGHADPVDLKLHAFCRGTAGAVLQACLSVDSGQTCATGIQEVACSASFADHAVPSGFPTAMFAGWGSLTKDFTLNALKALPSTVSVTGNIVTQTGGEPFLANRVAGSKLFIAATSAAGCPNGYCTVASYDSPTQITISETVAGTVTGAMFDVGGGVRVALKATGGSPTVDANFTYDHVEGQQFIHGSNSESYPCSTLPITDIATDGAGAPLGATLSGYLCVVGSYFGGGSALFLMIPSTGEFRLMSTFKRGPNRYLPFSNAFSASNAKTFFASDSSLAVLYKGVLGPAPYLAYDGLFSPSDFVTWTNLSTSVPSIDAQIASAGGPVAAAYATRLFGSLVLQDLIAGQAFYGTGSGGFDAPCITARTNADTNLLIDAQTSFSTYPMRWGACHSGAQGFGSYRILVTNTPWAENSSKSFIGPHMLRITQMKRAGVWQTFSVPLTAATNANPVQFTAISNGLDPGINNGVSGISSVGPQITISGGTGAWTAINGTWPTTKIDADHFTIPVNTSGLGAVSGTLIATGAPPIIHAQINSITTATPAVVTVSTYTANETQARNIRLQDGDPIAFPAQPSPKTQYYAKVTGYSPFTFGVYADSALTTPVNGNTLQSYNTYMGFSETCPASNPPWDQPTNLDSGAVGARCITVRVAGEPCSSWATVTEHNAFPCPSDPSNVSKSMLQTIQPGDAIRDRNRNPYSETMTLVKKVKNSETDIELTFSRWTPNRVQGGDDSSTSSDSSTHDWGWTPIMVPSNSHACANVVIDGNDPTHAITSFDSSFCVNHGDFSWDPILGRLTYTGGNGFGGTDSIVSVTPAQFFATKPTYTQNGLPNWASSPGSQLIPDFHIQTYATHRQVGAPLAEQVWKGDWTALNTSFGGAESAGGVLYTGTVTAVAGTVRLYKISNGAATFKRKVTPTYAWAGRFMFKDKSGPGSLITDSDNWQYCVADFAGECRPGSAVNDTFVNAPIYHNKNGQCWTNALDIIAPCFIGLPPVGGWAIQDQISPIDTAANRVRRLTLGLNAPGMHFTFASWQQTTGGQWGFFAASFVNGLRNDYFAMKLPAWPGSKAGLDSATRTEFIPTRRTIPAGQGVYARARFGYAENGPPGSFYCTSRQEGCSTELPSAASGDPYSFLSEAVTRQTCNSGCKVTIPAVPGRVLYFVIDRLDALGNIVSTSPMEALAIQ